MTDRLVEEITHRGSEWPGEDKRAPEKRDFRNVGPVVGYGKYGQSGTKYQGAPS